MNLTEYSDPKPEGVGDEYLVPKPDPTVHGHTFGAVLEVVAVATSVADASTLEPIPKDVFGEPGAGDAAVYFGPMLDGYILMGLPLYV